MLSTLILASTFLLMASRLAYPLSRSSRNEVGRQDELSRQLNFEQHFRADITSAASIEVESAARVKLVDGKGADIAWAIDGNAAVRETKSDSNRWESIFKPDAAFKSRGRAAIEVGEMMDDREMKEFSNPTILLAGWADR